MPVRVYIDTDVILDLLSEVEERRVIDGIATALDEGRLTFVCSELTLIEALVHAVQTNNKQFEQVVRGFLGARPRVIIVPITTAVLERGLVLRAKHGLKTPDAIHVATGSLTNCSHYLTRDRAWSRSQVAVTTALDLLAIV